MEISGQIRLMLINASILVGLFVMHGQGFGVDVLAVSAVLLLGIANLALWRRSNR